MLLFVCCLLLFVVCCLVCVRWCVCYLFKFLARLIVCFCVWASLFVCLFDWAVAWLVGCLFVLGCVLLDVVICLMSSVLLTRKSRKQLR